MASATFCAGNDPKPFVHFGRGRLSVLPKVLARHAIGSVFLVSGDSAYYGSGAERVMAPVARSLRVRRFSEFTPNPKIEDIERAVAALRSEPFGAVIAIGGGTAMDIAKAAAVLASQQRSPAACLSGGQQLDRREHLLVLVPTTAGTGSEVTSFSVVYRNGVKYSLDDPALIADHAIVDPELTVGQPSRMAASAALDALSQAIESLWSVKSTVASRRNARLALRLSLANIESYCVRPTPAARTAMARAALRAGYAINVTRTTGPHALSYSLTTCYGIPHGHACALTLPAFLLYNAGVSDADVVDGRGAPWVKRRIREVLDLLGAASPKSGVSRLRRLVGSVGLETDLSSLGLGPEAVERLVAQGLDLRRAGNNPRRLTQSAIREILGMTFGVGAQ